MKVAIIHDWLTGMRGGEKCLEVFCELFPGATLFTLVHKKGSVSPAIEKMDIRTSFLQKFPDIENSYRYYLPLMPSAVRSFDLAGFDLVLSSSHCAAKGVKVPHGSLHICYCYTPMRYIWDMYGQYFGGASFAVKAGMGVLRPFLRRWDVGTSKSVDSFIAISKNVQERIKRIYCRDSEVIYPPADTGFYTPDSGTRRGDYYLIVSAFAPYKRIDIAIEAFNRSGQKLKVIGSGQSEKYLRKIAAWNIEFLGWLENEELCEHYRGCRALIFPGEEDFGIVPVEAQACGAPVIAYRKGGAVETVGEGVTGVFFGTQNVDSLLSAVKKFEGMEFDAGAIRANAVRFSRENFAASVKNFIEKKYKISKIGKL